MPFLSLEESITQFVQAHELRLDFHPMFSAVYRVIDTPKAMPAARPYVSPEHHIGIPSSTEQPAQQSSNLTSSRSGVTRVSGQRAQAHNNETERLSAEHCRTFEMITRHMNTADNIQDLIRYIDILALYTANMPTRRCPQYLKVHTMTGLTMTKLKESVATICRAIEVEEDDVKVLVNKLSSPEKRAVSEQLRALDKVLKERYTSPELESGVSRIIHYFSV